MYRDISPPKKVWLGDERYILTMGIGQLHLEMDLGGGKKGLTIIWTAYYVPNLSGNLISVSYLTKRGYSVNFNDNRCHIFSKSQELCGVLAQEVDNLYILNAKPVIPKHAYVSRTMREMSESSDLEPSTLKTALVARTKKSKAPLGIWHRRLGHIALDAVKQLSSCNMVTGMEISSKDTHGSTCMPCLEGKQTQDDIPKESTITHPQILHRIYSDLCGPMQTQGRQGEHYFLTFIDGNTHYLKVKLLRSKDETCKALKALIERAMVETGERVNYFHSDGLDQRNWLPTSSQRARTLKNTLTPHEAYTSSKPSVAHLRIFGCKAYAHVPKEKHQKLDKKTMECIHVGYSEHKKAYLLIHRSSGRIVESRDVHFDEGELAEPTRVRIETEVC